MNFSVACECSRLCWSQILGRLRVWSRSHRDSGRVFSLSCEPQESDGSAPADSVCLLSWLWVCAQQGPGHSTGRDFFISTTSLGPSAHSTELLEQSWPRICSEITPGAGEAENPISAGLVDAVRVLQLRVSLSQLWDTGLAQQP